METLFQMATVGLGFDRINMEEHGDIISSLSSLEFTDTQQIKLLLLPRNSYKTTLASVSFPIFKLAQDPNLRILIDSETYNLSKSILSEIKEHYTSPTSPLAKTKYSLADRKRYSFSRWAEDSIILPSRTIPKKEGSINAAGVDGVKAGMHYDIIICDDLHSQHNTKNEYQIQQVRDHFKLILSILDPHGIIIVIGTRWVENDTYEMIEEYADDTIFIPATSVLPMNIGSKKIITDTNQLVYNNYTNKPEEMKEFYLNFPKALSLAHLNKLETRQGEYIYSAQYLLKPVAARKKKFKEEWLKYFTIVPKGVRRFATVDPAFSTEGDSDFTGIIIVAVDSDRNIYVEHEEEIKLEPTELLEYMFELQKAHGVDEWYIEEVAAQKVLRFFLEYMAEKEDKHINVYPVKSFGRKKDIRILSLQPYFQAGKVFLRQGKFEGMGDEESALLNQLRKYPLLAHDDVIDALAYVPQIIYDGEEIVPEVPRQKGITMNSLLQEQVKHKGIMSWREMKDSEVVYYEPV